MKNDAKQTIRDNTSLSGQSISVHDTTDGVRVLAKKDVEVTNVEIQDNRPDQYKLDEHCDGYQLIPNEGDPRSAYSLGQMIRLAMSFCKVLAPGSFLQGIFASDGLHKELRITDCTISTASTHEISIRGMVSGFISNNRRPDGTLCQVDLRSARIGGRTYKDKERKHPYPQILIVSFKDPDDDYAPKSEIIDPADGFDHVNDTRTVVDQESGDVYFGDFDKKGYRAAVARLPYTKDVNEHCLLMQRLACQFGTVLAGDISHLVETVEPVVEELPPKEAEQEWEYPVVKEYETLDEFATAYAIPLAHLEAIVNVESKGEGFYKGRSSKLFECHLFYKELVRRGVNFSSYMLDAKYRDIIRETRYSKYGKFSKQQERFDLACTINVEAAICATSMGFAHVLGMNWKACGFNNPRHFHECMRTHEGQMRAFIGYIIACPGLVEAIRVGNWHEVKRLYNGPLVVDKNNDGQDDYVQAIVKELTRSINRNSSPNRNIKGAVKSRTFRNTVTSIVGKTAAGGATVKVGGDTLSAVIEGLNARKAEIEQVQDMVVSGVDTVKEISSDVAAMTGLLDQLVWIQYGMAALIILLILPNLRALYAWGQDNGFLASRKRFKGSMKFLGGSKSYDGIPIR